MTYWNDEVLTFNDKVSLFLNVIPNFNVFFNIIISGCHYFHLRSCFNIFWDMWIFNLKCHNFKTKIMSFFHRLLITHVILVHLFTLDTHTSAWVSFSPMCKSRSFFFFTPGGSFTATWKQIDFAIRFGELGLSVCCPASPLLRHVLMVDDWLIMKQKTCGQ